MLKRIFSVDTTVVYNAQQALSYTDVKVVGSVIRETIKVFGWTLREKYVTRSSHPVIDAQNVFAQIELDRVTKNVDEACMEKLREYEKGK